MLFLCRWLVETCPDSADGFCDQQIIPPGSSVCRSIKTTDNGELKATMYGSGDLAVSQLSAFSETYFRGTTENVGSEFADIAIGTANSYVITGLDDWAVFSEPNFEGDEICLRFTALEQVGYGITYNWNRLIKIKSARPGCSEATTAGPSSTTIASTTPTTANSTATDEPTTTEKPNKLEMYIDIETRIKVRIV